VPASSLPDFSVVIHVVVCTNVFSAISFCHTRTLCVETSIVYSYIIAVFSFQYRSEILTESQSSESTAR